MVSIAKNFVEGFQFRSRRGFALSISEVIKSRSISLPALPDQEVIRSLEGLNLAYRTLCSLLYNFVPTSGHPGGSISSGQIVQSLIFQTMDYDFSDPDAQGADILCYAAGHKALGLYAAWALRNEIIRIYQPKMLPLESKQLRLEDLLGFRRNPLTSTPLFKKYHAKALDGHPVPLVPFVKLSTGASGVGVASAIGLALAAYDVFRSNPPKVHILEGEGGLTPGRVSEAMASASASGLSNVILHVDWNQSSIDSDHVCSEHDIPGDYVQWTPDEFARLHDWNVITVSNGTDFHEILMAQSLAVMQDNSQPTAIVYRTVKGWKYGIEGRKSHGAGHKFCSKEFYASLEEFENRFSVKFPRPIEPKTPTDIEEAFFLSLMTVRSALEREIDLGKRLSGELLNKQAKLQKLMRHPHTEHPHPDALFSSNKINALNIPEELKSNPGSTVPLREVLGDALGYLNRKSGGAFMVASADLLGSTSALNINKGFQGGFFHATENPNSRLISLGGICEDAMGGVLSGLSTFGFHIGVGSSYAAFIGALQHISAKLHVIGQQYASLYSKKPFNPFIIICGHAGLKTGEDGPTHADVQALQLFEENFPRGSLLTLTPWAAQEIWPLLVTALQKRPAVILPFVTRPSETVPDWSQFASTPLETTKGLYALKKASSQTKEASKSVVLQGSEVAICFVNDVLPKLNQDGFDFNVFYVSSAELFDLLSDQEKTALYSPDIARRAMAITGFTLPTMYRWMTSEEGRRRTLHPLMKGSYPASGTPQWVMEQAGLSPEHMYLAVKEYMLSSD